MKHSFSITVGACALAMLANGSLLGDLLGNIDLQVNVCPQLYLESLRRRDTGKDPVMQSTNPACPNYVPPEQMPAIDSVPESSDTAIPDPDIIPSSTVPQRSTNTVLSDPIGALELLTIVAKPETLDVSTTLLPFPTNEWPAPQTAIDHDNIGWNMPLPASPETTRPSRCIPAKQFAESAESSAPSFGDVKSAIPSSAIELQIPLIPMQTPMATVANSRDFTQPMEMQTPESLPEWPAEVVFETRNVGFFEFSN